MADTAGATGAAAPASRPVVSRESAGIETLTHSCYRGSGLLIILKERVLFLLPSSWLGLASAAERKVDLKPFRRRECFGADTCWSAWLNHPGEPTTGKRGRELWFEGILRSQ